MPEADAKALVYLGVALVLVAVLLIAVGANIQRLALQTVPREKRVCRFLSARSLLWFVGLSIYFFANVLYTFGLVYAPASLCATLMAAIIPLNAMTSRCILGEVLELVDVQGGLCITAGISLAAWAAPYTTDSYTAAELRRLFVTSGSIGVLVGLCAILIALAIAILCHEGCCDGPSTDEKKTAPTTAASSSTKSCLASAMPFAYPVVVGLLESLVQVFQKGGSSMIALTVAGTSQLGDDTFWYVMSAWVLCSVAVVFWLRKGLENIAANRMLPIEYGTFTAASVLAGLVIYDEVRFVSAAHRGVMAAGVLLVSAGCALVGSRRALRCECSVRCTADDEERESAGARRLQEELMMREHLSEHLLPRAAARSDDDARGAA